MVWKLSEFPGRIGDAKQQKVEQLGSHLPCKAANGIQYLVKTSIEWQLETLILFYFRLLISVSVLTN